MKRLLVCLVLVTALVALFALAPPASAANRQFALLDNVPIEETPGLVASATITAKPAVSERLFLSKTFDQTAKNVDRLDDVGQQSASAQIATMVFTGDENRGSSSTPGTKRVGQNTTARYFFGDRFTGDSHPALRPDPHLNQVQVLA